jgi:hypothetical protein
MIIGDGNGTTGLFMADFHDAVWGQWVDGVHI